MLIRQPGQKGPAFSPLVRRHRGRCRLQLTDDALHLVHHWLPVLHGPTHICQHRLQPGDQCCALLGVHQSVDLNAHPGFTERLETISRREFRQVAIGIPLHGKNGMNYQVQGETLPFDLHDGAVHQKGHVVVNDLNNRVTRTPAVVHHRRAENPDFGFAWHPLRTKLPVRQYRTPQIFSAALGQIVRVQLAQILATKHLNRTSVPRTQPGGSQSQHGLNAFIALYVWKHFHDGVLRSSQKN